MDRPFARNRSIPDAALIPELAYDDVPAAAAWLCRAFGLTERLRIGSHRIQLVYRTGAVVVVERPPDSAASAAILMRVDDARAHHARAVEQGARVVRPLADYPYGERQYTAEDVGGHRWTFTETIADSDPATWGGQLLV